MQAPAWHDNITEPDLGGSRFQAVYKASGFQVTDVGKPSAYGPGDCSLVPDKLTQQLAHLPPDLHQS